MDRRLDPRVARLLPAAVDVQGRVRGAGRAGHPAQVPLSRCIMHRMLDRTRPGTVRARARSALETPWRRLLGSVTLQCCACGLCRRVPETERGVYYSDFDSEFRSKESHSVCLAACVGHTHHRDAEASSQKCTQALTATYSRLRPARAWVWEHRTAGPSLHTVSVTLQYVRSL